MYWLNTLLGLALVVAPFTLGYTTNTPALVSNVVLGAVIALISAYKALVRDDECWQARTGLVIGVIAVLVPFVFGFSSLAAALWPCIILGVLMVALSGYELYTAREAS